MFLSHHCAFKATFRWELSLGKFFKTRNNLGLKPSIPIIDLFASNVYGNGFQFCSVEPGGFPEFPRVTAWEAMERAQEIRAFCQVPGSTLVHTLHPESSVFICFIALLNEILLKK